MESKILTLVIIVTLSLRVDRTKSSKSWMIWQLDIVEYKENLILYLNIIEYTEDNIVA